MPCRGSYHKPQLQQDRRSLTVYSADNGKVEEWGKSSEWEFYYRARLAVDEVEKEGPRLTLDVEERKLRRVEGAAPILHGGSHAAGVIDRAGTRALETVRVGLACSGKRNTSHEQMSTDNFLVDWIFRPAQ